MSAGTGPGGAIVKARGSTMGLVFGGGIDRSSGLLAGDGNAQADLRNAHLRRGRIQMRKGLHPTASFGSAEPINGLALESAAAGVVVTFTPATREVHVWRTDGDGENPELVGLWFTAHPTTGRPVVSLAENGGRMFLAHDDPFITRRAPTVFYYIETDSLHPLTADWATELTSVAGLGTWAQTGQAVIKFRGVLDYLEAYIIGWGYGSREEDGPEVVRASIPGLVNDEGDVFFDIEHYWIVGSRRVPVLSCVPAGSVLLAMKASETGAIIGDSWLNFGSLKADLRFGIASSRLAIHLAGACYAWSLEGPQVSNGGPFEDLSLPLDLGGPSPEDLAEEGDLEEGFVVYLPVHRELWWVFGRRCYALSLRDPQNVGWSYHEFAVPLTGGFILYGSEAVSTAPPTGYPEYLRAESDPWLTKIVIENHGHIGDERVDLFLRPDGDVWDRVRTVTVKNGAGEQEIPQEGLPFGVLFDAALRHRRGSEAAPGYEGEDPDTWTAGTVALSKGQFSTPIPAPLEFGGVWSRTSDEDEQIALTWEDPEGCEGLRRRVLRDDAEIEDLDPEVVEFVDDTIDGEELYKYSVRYYTPDVEGIEAVVNVWSGPLAPTIESLTNPSLENYTVTWQNGEPLALVEVEDDLPGPGFALRHTTTIPGSTDHTAAVPDSFELNVAVRLRHVWTQFGVDDFSAYSDQLNVDLDSDIA